MAVEKTPSPPNKKIKSPKRNTIHPLNPVHVQQSYYPQPSMKGGMIFMHGVHGGAFSNPRSSPYSGLLSYSSLPPYTYLKKQNNNNPPLLPLPDVTKPAFLSLPAPASSAHSLSKRKQQQPRQQHKAMKKSTPTHSTVTKSDDIVQAQKSVKRLGGSDPRTGPKEAARVGDDDDMKEEESSVLSMCPPPPSSLPMPKFSLVKQPKLISCTVEAVSDEIDDGATDNLRRMLRLR